MDWQNYPLIRLVIPFVVGMVGANLFLPHMDVTVLFILCCAVLAFLFFFIPQQPDTYRDGKFGILAMTFAFLLGMTLYTRKHQRTAQGIPQDTTLICGILSEPPTEKARSWALDLAQENGTHILLYVGKSGLSLHLGDTILARPTHFNPTANPADDAFRPYHQYLFYHGICATAYAPSHRWTLHPQQGSPSLLHRIKNLQTRLHRIYDGHGINGETGSIVEAMTIGRKADLSADLRQAYAASGVSHILALSGFHVGIIVLLLQALLFYRLMPLRWRWFTHLLTLLVLWAFAAVAGFSPSLTRATLMYSILLLCQSFSHELLSLNSCALALLIMLCINPLQLHDVGFQLSFVSVISISLSAPLLSSSLFATRPLLVQLIGSLLLITLVCTLATAPLVAYHFGRIPLLAIFSNLLITPFVYLLMYASLLWWLFLWCAPIHSWLTALLNWAADTMNGLTTHLSSLPFATAEWHPNALTTLLCYILLLTLFIKIKK